MRRRFPLLEIKCAECVWWSPLERYECPWQRSISRNTLGQNCWVCMWKVSRQGTLSSKGSSEAINLIEQTLRDCGVSIWEWTVKSSPMAALTHRNCADGLQGSEAGVQKWVTGKWAAEQPPAPTSLWSSVVLFASLCAFYGKIRNLILETRMGWKQAQCCLLVIKMARAWMFEVQHCLAAENQHSEPEDLALVSHFWELALCGPGPVPLHLSTSVSRSIKIYSEYKWGSSEIMYVELLYKC